MDEFESWFIAVPQDKQLHYVKLLSKAKRKRGARRNEEIEKVISKAIEDLVDSELREKIRNRLLRQAPLLFISYGEEKCAWALAAAEKLKKDSPLSISEHPFIREMMIIGLSHLVEGL